MAVRAISTMQQTIDRLNATAKTMSDQLVRIKKAVGPRIQKKAGL